MDNARRPPPPIRRELTLRALLTGIAIGALLTPTNVYAGLKIGWSFNLSITALLIGYAFWRPITHTFGGAAWDRYESNISQTAASSAASIISGGLVAPIPAYLILTGETLHLVPMTAWVFSVSFLGVWVAWFLRGPLLSDPRLPFPVGVATAETIRDIFERGREALLRCWALGASLLFAAGFTLLDAWVMTMPRLVPTRRLEQLTFGFDPSLLMLGFGAIIGLRTGLSLLLGAVLAWGVLAPALLATEQVVVVDAEAATAFSPLVEWLIWPGVSLMVAASAASILRWPSARRTLAALTAGTFPWRASGWPVLGLLVAAVLTIGLQIALFDVFWAAAVLAVPMAFVLAAVAARVVGETGIAPIGAIGKVAQLSFAATAPGHATTNLMTANVAGGAAGQCADLLNDLKTGTLIGASAWRQALAQCGGILTGSVVGSAVFVYMIPRPAEQLLSAEWPAPAVAVWKAVAETLALGFDSVPASARAAVLVAAVIGL
ncbi:MAG: OPT/YSL family transporter, partial [Gammaproteobacteria bacterium]